MKKVTNIDQICFIEELNILEDDSDNLSDSTKYRKKMHIRIDIYWQVN